MKNTYQQTMIGGFKVEVFTTYDGTELFITDANGVEVYAAKVSGDAFERAMEIIGAPVAVAEAASAPEMICFAARLSEFYAAVTRDQKGDLEVFETLDRNTFVVKNFENGNQYAVRLAIVEGELCGSCECADFTYRKRICKHASKVLAVRMTKAVFA